MNVDPDDFTDEDGLSHDYRCMGDCGPCGGIGGVEMMRCLYCGGDGKCKGCASVPVVSPRPNQQGKEQA